MIVLNFMNLIGVAILFLLWKVHFEIVKEKFEWLDKVVLFFTIGSIGIAFIDMMQLIF